jgi:hypothetical protein
MSGVKYNPISLSSASLDKLTVSGAWLTNPIINDRYKVYLPVCELLECDGYYGSLQIMVVFVDVVKDEEMRACITDAIALIENGMGQCEPDNYDFDFEVIVKIRFPAQFYFWLMKSFLRIGCEPAEICELLKLTIEDVPIWDKRDIYISLYGITESEWFSEDRIVGWNIGHFLNWAKAYPFITPRSDQCRTNDNMISRSMT